MRLTEEHREAMHLLWDELADFPASDIDGALRHLMQTLAGALRADNVLWVGAARLSHGAMAKRDPQLGWRGLVVRQLNSNPQRIERSAQAAREQDTRPGLTTLALISGAGHPRVHRLHDGFIDVAAFKKTGHYRVFYEEVGITDRMYVGFPVNADAESYFLLDRVNGATRFTALDAALVTYAMRGLKWFQRELLLSHGLLLARQPLTDTERRIAALLLTEKSEKEIAAELRQSPSTTHKYITGILRKFAVRGRTGLMAVWLGRRG